MAKPILSNKRKVINFLSSGKTLTAAQARSRYGIKNFRATISSIRTLVEEHGNWTITNDGGRYSMCDTHPGRRMFTFDRGGHRTAMKS